MILRPYKDADAIREMVKRQEDMKVPTELLPTCPHCGKPMTMNLRCDDTHHDGTNHHLVRVWKDGISDHLREKLHDAILSGHATPTLYGRYTNAVGKDIANVYGWKVRGMK